MTRVAALNEAADIAAKFTNEDAAAAKACSDFDTSMAFVYQRDRSRAIENAIRKVCNERDEAKEENAKLRDIAKRAIPQLIELADGTKCVRLEDFLRERDEALELHWRVRND